MLLVLLLVLLEVGLAELLVLLRLLSLLQVLLGLLLLGLGLLLVLGHGVEGCSAVRLVASKGRRLPGLAGGWSDGLSKRG